MSCTELFTFQYGVELFLIASRCSMSCSREYIFHSTRCLAGTVPSSVLLMMILTNVDVVSAAGLVTSGTVHDDL
jgi:hypothetical protein